VDLSYPADSAAFRTHVRQVLDENLPERWAGTGALDADGYRRFEEEWRVTLHENDLLAVNWPVEYGGAGLSALEQLIVAEECTRAGVPQGGLNDNFSVQMLGPTLLEWGTEEQKRHYLPRILSREDVWCQGFSEPGAGSDLAGIRTRARLDGDHWVIDGQKIWTSYGHLASHVFVLARTNANPNASRHKSISFLLCPLDQEGIEVRPLKMMTGDEEFTEVFFTGAICLAENVLGPVDSGWSVAMTLLGFERGETAATLPAKFAKDVERLVELARQYDLLDDPVIRGRLALAYEGVEQMRCLGLRAVTRWLAGADIGPESSVHKLFWSEWLQRTTDLAIDIMGLDGLTPVGVGLQGVSFPAAEAGTPNTTGAWVDYFLRARAATIYAGSSEIQRNIIGERILGLPKGPR
jgi:alkylation response protein AidB-like acyl-CoA dehydrogenase